MTGGKKDCLYIRSLSSGRGARIQAVSKLAHNGEMIAYEFNGEEFHIPINHAFRITPVDGFAFRAEPVAVPLSATARGEALAAPKKTVTTTVKKGFPAKKKARGKRSKPVANAS